MVVREAHDGSDGSRYRAWDAMKPERDATVRFLSAATTQQQPRPLQHGVDDEEAEALASFVSFFGPQLLHARSSASSVHVRPRRSRRDSSRRFRAPTLLWRLRSSTKDPTVTASAQPTTRASYNGPASYPSISSSSRS